MTRFALAQLRTRRLRAAALALAILVAAATFTLLTAAAETSRLSIHGTLQSNYRAAYDVLVRPRNTATRLEREARLVRPNFLSGIFGGITLREYGRIKSLPSVEVAAPVANIGYVLPWLNLGVTVDDFVSDEPVQLFRVRPIWFANGGSSRYVGQHMYVYVTRRNPFHRLTEVVPGKGQLSVCNRFPTLNVGRGPFAPQTNISCYSTLTPWAGRLNGANLGRSIPATARGAVVGAYYPMLLAAVDPVAEARLLGLDRTVVEGRYLSGSDRVAIRPGGYFKSQLVPVIAGTKTYVDEKLVVEVQRLQIPQGTNVPVELSSSHAIRFADDLRGPTVARRFFRQQSLYDRVMRQDRVFSPSFWTTSNIRYRRTVTKALKPTPTQNPWAVWKNPLQRINHNGGYWTAPPENADLQFRRLFARPGSNLVKNGVYATPWLKVVGRYDPGRLPGFSRLSRVPLETYYPPSLQPADTRSRRALKGRPLLPTQNLGDYISQPPLLLTTLKAMKPFLNPQYFKGANPRAPISAIRVRVKGVSGPDELSQARVRAVAQQIHEKSGLQVDITAGSSPKPLLVRLPAGKFGRPELLLREGWSKKGVSISFLQALDRKSLALFGLVLVVCAFFLGNGALASVRARRRELGTLLTLGWSQRTIFAAVLAELALVGLAAGLLGVALAVAIVELFGLELSLWRTVLVLPIALLLALVAGLLPALEAARGTPLDAIQPPVVPGRRVRRVRRFLTLALVNLRRLPVRTAIGASGLSIGVAALTVLIAIQRAFQGVLVDTLLGQAISLQVRDSDLVAAALTVALSGLAVADVLYLNLRDRAAELVTLRTVGWTDRHLATLVAIEGLTLGLLGSVGGAVIGIAIGAGLLGVPLSSLALAGALAAAGGVVVALLASLLPLSQLARLTPPAVLAEE